MKGGGGSGPAGQDRSTEVAHRWRFYRTPQREVAKEELQDLPEHAQAAMADLMKRFRRGEHLPRECESIGNGLHALRVSLGHNEFRGLFAYEGRGRVLLVLTFFAKKDERLRTETIRRARTRWADWQRQGSSG